MRFAAAQRTGGFSRKARIEPRWLHNRGPENACCVARRRRGALLDLGAGNAGLVSCNSLLGATRRALGSGNCKADPLQPFKRGVRGYPFMVSARGRDDPPPVLAARL